MFNPRDMVSVKPEFCTDPADALLKYEVVRSYEGSNWGGQPCPMIEIIMDGSGKKGSYEAKLFRLAGIRRNLPGWF